MIEGDIYNGIIELKAKNEVKQLSRNYRDVGKKVWRVLKRKEIEEKQVGNVMTGSKIITVIRWPTHRFTFRIFFFLFSGLTNEHIQI